MFGAIKWLFAKVALLAGLAGLVLHMTVRDGQPILSTVFYALPLPVVGALFLMAALLTVGRGARRVLYLVALLTLGTWFHESCGWAYPVKGDWKMITWNMGRPKHPFLPLITLVRMEQPDVIVLVESGGIAPEQARAYESVLPGYRMFVGKEGLSCLVRGEILGTSMFGFRNASDVAHVRIKLGAEKMNVFIADLGAGPFLSREPQLETLAQKTCGESRTIVMGDFNAPLESVFFDGMRAHFSDVMDGPHRGFRETWFYGLPLLSLDHVWLSRDLVPRFATRRLTFASDHAPVIATFSARR